VSPSRTVIVRTAPTTVLVGSPVRGVGTTNL
jgi:hypothetical protein